jgi:hypothetical protein
MKRRGQTSFALGLAVAAAALTLVQGAAADDPYWGNVPGPQVIAEAQSAIGAPVMWYFPTAHSQIDGNKDLPVWCTHFGGQWYPIGTTTVVCYATDSAHQTTGASFEVIVRDTSAPALTIPSDVTLEATGAAGAAVTYAATAYDLVDGGRAISCAPSSGSVFAIGTTTTSCTSTDSRGNKGTRTFKVTVRDTTRPIFGAAPANSTLEATGSAGAVATFTPPTATDIVDGTITSTCAPASGSTFALGQTTVSCTATDAHANSATTTFTVTVSDTTAPSLAVPGNKTVKAKSAKGARVTYTAKATDVVDGAVKPRCTPASGKLFKVGTTTVTCRATDAAGNRATKTFRVRVKR